MDEALGESFSGVLVSDFYAAYHHYDGPKQRCWAHLLRDIHDLVALYPKDTALAQWAAAVHQLYVEARSFTHPQAQRRRTAQLAWERQLLVICQPFLADPLALQGRLCRRIERHIKELFVFVAEPDVPSDNNPAERSLRHVVISRKISGGTRSERGTESKMTLASIFGTWRARGLNPLAACRQLLTSPSTLNCYQSPANVTGAHRLRRQPTKPDENAGLGQPPALPQPCVTIPCILHGKAPVAVLNCSVEDDRV